MSLQMDAPNSTALAVADQQAFLQAVQAIEGNADQLEANQQIGLLFRMLSVQRQKDIQDFHEVKRGFEAEIGRLKQHCEQLQGQLGTANASNDDLKKQLQKVQAELERKISEFEAKKKDYEDLSKKLGTQEGFLKTKSAEIEEIKKACQKAEKDAQDAKRVNVDWQGVHNQWLGVHAHLTEQVRVLNLQVEAHKMTEEQNRLNHQKQLTDLQTLVDKCAKDNAALQLQVSELEELKRQNGYLKDKIAELSRPLAVKGVAAAGEVIHTVTNSYIQTAKVLFRM